MAILPPLIAAKLAALVTVSSIAVAGVSATRPPSPDPVTRTQQQQSQYANDKKTRRKTARQRGDLGRAIDIERANRAVPSQHAPVRFPRLLRLLRLR